MKISGKLIAIGLALATATGVAGTAAPAAARTQVYLGVDAGPAYYPAGWRGDYRDRGFDRNWDRRDWNRRGWDRRNDWDRGWDRRGWRDDRFRGGYGWRGGYRERCWTEWRGGRWGRSVRICR